MNGHVAGTPHHSASTKFVLVLIAAVALIAIGVYVGSTMNGPSRIQETNSPAASATSENQESGTEEDPASTIDVDEPEPATFFSWEDIGHAPNTPQENFADTALTAHMLEQELFVEVNSKRVVDFADSEQAANAVGISFSVVESYLRRIEEKKRGGMPDGYIFYCQVKSPDGSYQAHVLAEVLQADISTPEWTITEITRKEL